MRGYKMRKIDASGVGVPEMEIISCNTNAIDGIKAAILIQHTTEHLAVW